MPIDPAPEPPPWRPSSRGLRLSACLAGVLALGIVGLGVFSRASQTHRTQMWTSSQAIPVVSLVAPLRETEDQTLVLPGTLSAFINAPIYARVPGYLKAWTHDIGARVKAGEVLATIDTPDLDQQIVQARADLATAQANRDLAQTTAKRWAALLKQDAVSAQEADEKNGDLASRSAQVNAAKANLGRLTALKGFARIVAPFDGVVTARKTDIGFLINAGAGASPSSELFDVAKVDKLRLYVSVPQAYSARIHSGVRASLTVPEYAGRVFAADHMVSSNAVSASNGAVLVEMRVDNADGALKAGDYAQVTFQMPQATGGQTVRLPSSVLIFRNKTPEVAVLGAQDRVILKPVLIGLDLGTTIEIAAGLAPGDQVIDNPPDSLTSGQLVRVAQPKDKRGSAETIGRPAGADHAAG